VRLDTDGAPERDAALQLHEALARAGDDQAAAAAPAGRLAGQGRQGRVELRAVVDQPAGRAGAAQAPDEARRVPGRSARERAPLEE